jgi:hypothetical protein
MSHNESAIKIVAQYTDGEFILLNKQH